MNQKVNNDIHFHPELGHVLKMNMAAFTTCTVMVEGKGYLLIDTVGEQRGHLDLDIALAGEGRDYMQRVVLGSPTLDGIEKIAVLALYPG